MKHDIYLRLKSIFKIQRVINTFKSTQNMRYNIYLEFKKLWVPSNLLKKQGITYT